jgi:hypothetical protein
VQYSAETLIDGQLVPDVTTPATYRVQFTQSAPTRAGEEAGAAGGGGGRVAETRGDVGLVLTGTWDMANHVFTAGTENVVISEALRRGMPRQAREWCEEHQLNGRLSQMKMTFSEREGLTLAVQFDGVSMMWMVEPEQGIGMGEDRPAYPLTVSDTRGAVIFSPNSGGMKIVDVRGEVLGYQFIADGVVRGTGRDAPYELNLRFPGAVLGDRYPPLFMAFLTSQDLMQRVQPHGKVDIAIGMKRLAPRAAPQVNGEVDCHDVRIRFAHLPYPLDHLNGRITFDEQSVTFHDVTAQSDENRVMIRGTAGTNWTNPMIDFLVTSDHALFDDRLAACLPEKFAGIWDLFSIRGYGSFTCRVTRSNALFDAPKVVVDVNVEDGTGYVKAVPYVFSNAKGKFHLEGDETRIEGLTAVTGEDGSGRVTLSGVVRHPGGDITDLRPQLKLTADVPVDRAMLHAVPAELAAKLNGVEVGGRLNFDGTVARVAAKDGATPGSAAEVPQVAGVVRWSHGTLKTEVVQLPVDLGDIQAEAAVTPAGIDLRSFDALLRVPQAAGGAATNPAVEQVRLKVAGKVDLGTMAGVMTVRGDADTLTLPAALPAAVPNDWAETWRAYSPAGKVGVSGAAVVRIHGAGGATQPAAGSQSAASFAGFTVDTYDATVTPLGVKVQASDWPEAVDGVRGSVHVRPGAVEMKEMTAAVGGGVTLAWGGALDTETGRWSLQGKGESRGLPTKWLSYLPADLAKNLDTARDGAALALEMRELVREGPDKPWQFDATLATQDLGLTGPLPMSAAKANLVAKGTYAPAGTGGAGGERAARAAGALDFSAVLAAADVLVSDHLVETVTARVAVVAADKSVHLSEIDGKVAGGDLDGRVHIYTELPAATRAAGGGGVGGVGGAAGAEPGGYQAELSLKNADLARLVLPAKATDEDRKKIGTGRVSATLALEERFGPKGTRTGRGELAVRDAAIYNVPIAMGLMQVATLRLPVARSFKQASMAYTIHGDEVAFDRILLESAGINLAGAGTVGISDKRLDLSFVTETPNELFIPILSPIIRETRNGLLQLSVTGTMDNPKVNPVPLSALSNTLRALLPQPKPRADGGR